MLLFMRFILCSFLLFITFSVSSQLQKPAVNSNTILTEGAKLHSEKKYKEAIKLYETVSRADTSYADILNNMALAYHADSNFLNSIAFLEKAIKLFPEKNDNSLNGVTTYDLVLISKHILGSEPFNSPYKIIAADANKSGSITTFDIVEIRKLILGIYTKLPNNKSWRFVDSSFVFPAANNPFQTVFPEGVNCITSPKTGIDFIGVKVGDVNNTAMGNRPYQRPNTHLSWPNLRTTPGGVLTVPIIYSGSATIEAIQLGLRFDPARLQLIGPSKGDIESYLPHNFNLLRAIEGEIRTLWIPMTELPEKIKPGNVLFYLSFKVLGEMPTGGLPLWLDDQLLDCAAWAADGAEWAVGHVPISMKRDESAAAISGLQASLRPNPTLGDVTLLVESLKAEKGRIALYDAFGRRLFMRELMLQEGRQDIPLQEAAQLPTGVYTWKVYTQSLDAQGHLIKQ